MSLAHAIIAYLIAGEALLALILIANCRFRRSFAGRSMAAALLASVMMVTWWPLFLMPLLFTPWKQER